MFSTKDRAASSLVYDAEHFIIYYMKQNLLKAVLVILTCLTITACRKNEMKSKSTTGLPPGLFILNDGQDLNGPPYYSASTLSFYNLSARQFTPDEYNAVNGKTLGYTGNDLEIYGSKMYIAVTNSSVIDVVNAKTGEAIKEISLLDPASPPPSYRYPRHMVFYKGNVYISCKDGTVAVMDTTNFSISATISLPGFYYLEGLVIQNDKLYVADAGIGTGVTNIVSVIDLSSNKEIKRISVIPYPVSLAADSYGNVYVLSGWTDDWQQFYVSTGGLTIIDSKTDSIKSPPVPGVYPANSNIPIIINGDLVYYNTGSTIPGENKIAVYNAKTQTPVTANFVTDGTHIQSSYSMCINPVTGEVYISDARDGVANGVVDVFDKTGKLEYSFATAVQPIKIKLLN